MGNSKRERPKSARLNVAERALWAAGTELSSVHSATDPSVRVTEGKRSHGLLEHL